MSKISFKDSIYRTLKIEHHVALFSLSTMMKCYLAAAVGLMGVLSVVTILALVTVLDEPKICPTYANCTYAISWNSNASSYEYTILLDGRSLCPSVQCRTENSTCSACDVCPSSLQCISIADEIQNNCPDICRHSASIIFTILVGSFDLLLMACIIIFACRAAGWGEPEYEELF